MEICPKLHDIKYGVSIGWKFDLGHVSIHQQKIQHQL
jgi:hypothetical protein